MPIPKHFDFTGKTAVITGGIGQVFARGMADRGSGVVINVTSMAADRPLTKIPAYSGAKAAVSNFTQWLAVHLAPAGIRANALAPGFFSRPRIARSSPHPMVPARRAVTRSLPTPRCADSVNRMISWVPCSGSFQIRLLSSPVLWFPWTADFRPIAVCEDGTVGL